MLASTCFSRARCDRGAASRLGRWGSAQLVLGAFLAVSALGQQYQGSPERAVSRISCVTHEQLSQILGYQESLQNHRAAITQGQDDDEILRNLLATATEVGQCLRDESLFPVDAEHRQDFHALQRAALRVYRDTGDALLRYKDRFVRASLAAAYCGFPDELPRPLPAIDSWACDDLVSTFLVDGRAIFSAARTIQLEPTGDLSAKLAKDLGLDLLDPAPEFLLLQNLLEDGMRLAVRHPEFGRQLSASMEPILCDALRLYPEQSEELTRAYNLLIRFGDGTFAAGARFYRFEQDLSREFRLQPADWNLSATPCIPVRNGLNLPDLIPEPAGAVASVDQLQAALDRICRNLESPAATETADSEPPFCKALESGSAVLASPGLAWRPFHRYGSFFWEFSKLLRIPSSASRSVQESRDFLASTSCDLLLEGILSSPQPTAAQELGEIRIALISWIEEHSRLLSRELRWRQMVKFAKRYLDKGGDRLTPSQREVLHGLLGEAYYMQGKSTDAVRHVHRSNGYASIRQLERKALELRRLGIQAGPRRK